MISSCFSQGSGTSETTNYHKPSSSEEELSKKLILSQTQEWEVMGKVGH